MSILDCFTLDDTHLTLKELSERVDLSTSTVSRLLNSLVALKLLHRNDRDKSYCLGPKLYHYGFLAKDNISVVKHAYPLMKRIRDKTKEAVTLYVLENDYRVCYEHVESLLFMSCVVRVGDRFPLWAGAGGKCILAYSDETYVLNEIEKAYPITGATITDRESFLSELASIRERGYAISHGEREEGVISVAVPIFEPPHRIFGCLSVAAPTVRLDEKAIEELIPELKDICSRISMNLGI
ncbi:IclR family transcriptional regulator [Dethiosulfovibrio peptidovorans]|uniref:IclR family transcriptional regulator n=1 Tax=Dethiosulfovibrio peptidovorans TaxID=47055 RepID=UPI002378C76D|nr:IclR family transcriptional regulator [Dethiosulfovibrio peptidovorans]